MADNNPEKQNQLEQQEQTKLNKEVAEDFDAGKIKDENDKQIQKTENTLTEAMKTVLPHNPEVIATKAKTEAKLWEKVEKVSKELNNNSAKAKKVEEVKDSAPRVERWDGHTVWLYFQGEKFSIRTKLKDGVLKTFIKNVKEDDSQAVYLENSQLDWWNTDKWSFLGDLQKYLNSKFGKNRQNANQVGKEAYRLVRKDTDSTRKLFYAKPTGTVIVEAKKPNIWEITPISTAFKEITFRQWLVNHKNNPKIYSEPVWSNEKTVGLQAFVVEKSSKWRNEYENHENVAWSVANKIESTSGAFKLVESWFSLKREEYQDIVNKVKNIGILKNMVNDMLGNVSYEVWKESCEEMIPIFTQLASDLKNASKEWKEAFVDQFWAIFWVEYNKEKIYHYEHVKELYNNKKYIEAAEKKIWDIETSIRTITHARISVGIDIEPVIEKLQLEIKKYQKVISTCKENINKLHWTWKEAELTAENLKSYLDKARTEAFWTNRTVQRFLKDKEMADWMYIILIGIGGVVVPWWAVWSMLFTWTIDAVDHWTKENPVTWDDIKDIFRHMWTSWVIATIPVPNIIPKELSIFSPWADITNIELDYTMEQNSEDDECLRKFTENIETTDLQKKTAEITEINWEDITKEAIRYNNAWWGMSAFKTKTWRFIKQDGNFEKLIKLTNWIRKSERSNIILNPPTLPKPIE